LLDDTIKSGYQLNALGFKILKTGFQMFSNYFHEKWRRFGENWKRWWGQLHTCLWNTSYRILMESQAIINLVESQEKLHAIPYRLQEINDRIQENLKILIYL